MPPKLRVEYPGAIYHGMSRGDRRKSVFLDESDCHDFIKTLGEACQKARFQVHAFCLMKNHFDLVLETPEGNLVDGLRWLLSPYSNRFNRRHKLFGPLFSGRYKALIVDGSGNGYLRTVCDYVHLNPVRAGLLKGGQSLGAYPWSSFQDYLRSPRRRPGWLRVDRLLGEMGIDKDDASGRSDFEERMERRRGQKLGAEWGKIRRGWCLGGASFRVKLLERMEGKLTEHHPGEQRREGEEQRGLRIIREGLREAGWTEATLRERRKSDAVKLALALRLRQQTTLTLKWIAERLQMGSWEYVSRLLYLNRTPRRKMS